MAKLNETQFCMFGGSNKAEYFSDLWISNLIGLWQRVEIEIEPTGRSGHSMINYKNNLIVFGGLGEIVHEKNDLIIFDFKSKQ